MPLPRKPVTITLDRERTIRFTLNSICRFEELTGGSLQSAFKSPTMTNVRMIIWAALIHEDPTLTVEAVGEMVDLADVRDLMGVKLPQALGTQVSESSDSPTPAGATTPANELTGAESGVSAGSILAFPMSNSGV